MTEVENNIANTSTPFARVIDLCQIVKQSIATLKTPDKSLTPRMLHAVIDIVNIRSDLLAAARERKIDATPLAMWINQKRDEMENGKVTDGSGGAEVVLQLLATAAGMEQGESELISEVAKQPELKPVAFAAAAKITENALSQRRKKAADNGKKFPLTVEHAEQIAQLKDGRRTKSGRESNAQVEEEFRKIGL